MTKTFTVPLTTAIAAADLIEIERAGVWHKLATVSKNAISIFVKNGKKSYENGFNPNSFNYTLIFGGGAEPIYVMIDLDDIVTIDNKGVSQLSNKTTEVYHNGVFGSKNNEPLDARIRFTMLRPCCMNFADTQKIKNS